MAVIPKHGIDGTYIILSIIRLFLCGIKHQNPGLIFEKRPICLISSKTILVQGITMQLFKKKEASGEPVKSKETKEEPKKSNATEGKSQPNGAYFVSPHPDGGWQVKRANAQKALKRFKTKAEAEAYAKQVAANQGENVVRQKKDGKIQKKH